MDEQTFRILILALCGGGVAVWALGVLLFRVSGSWVRELDAGQRQANAAVERVEFTQIGPFVNGRRQMPGGYQEFSGVMFWSTLRLKRRDHGAQSLVAQGFPKHIAPLVDGEITARLTLRLQQGGTLLSGSFSPQEINFTHQPPRITSRVYRAPQARAYTKLATAADDDAQAAWDVARDTEPMVSRNTTS